MWTPLQPAGSQGESDLTDDAPKTAKLRLVPGSPLKTADHLPRYVRVTERLPNGVIAFDFAVGTPDMFVELIVPEDAFEAFCENNNAVHMTPEQSAEVDLEMEKYRYGEEGMELKRAAARMRSGETEPS